jgi:hypothetical protein
MEIDAVDGWCGGVPPWLDAVPDGDLVFEGDVATDCEVAVRDAVDFDLATGDLATGDLAADWPVWDDVEVADLLAAGLGPELPQVTPASVAELLVQVAAMGPGVRRSPC